MSNAARFFFAVAMLGVACGLLSGNHTAAIANVAIALVWLYPDHPQQPRATK